MTPDDRILIVNLAREVGQLAGRVGDVREDVRALRDEVASVAVDVRTLQLNAATQEGATAATREVATQAGAAGARRERTRERVVNGGIAALAVVVSALGLLIRQP